MNTLSFPDIDSNALDLNALDLQDPESLRAAKLFNDLIFVDKKLTNFINSMTDEKLIKQGRVDIYKLNKTIEQYNSVKSSQLGCLNVLRFNRKEKENRLLKERQLDEAKNVNGGNSNNVDNLVRVIRDLIKKSDSISYDNLYNNAKKKEVVDEEATQLLYNEIDGKIKKLEEMKLKTINDEKVDEDSNTNKDADEIQKDNDYEFNEFIDYDAFTIMKESLKYKYVQSLYKENVTGTIFSSKEGEEWFFGYDHKFKLLEECTFDSTKNKVIPPITIYKIKNLYYGVTVNGTLLPVYNIDKEDALKFNPEEICEA